MPWNPFDNSDAEMGIKSRRTTDIELPNRSGKTDPRLKKPDVLGGFSQAAKGLEQAKKYIGKGKK